MQIIPLLDIPSQTLTITLGGQYCQIVLRTMTTGLYCDLYIGTTLIIGGVICENLNRIVRNRYLGFIGDILFLDQQGTDDPSSPGMGTRFILVYLEASDLVPAP